MGLRIASNIASEQVQRNLKESTRNLESEFSKLSSGKRITKAADDAAGLSIATKLKAHTKGLSQASRNANDGISLVQVAEGGLNEVSNIMVRLRELSVQAGTDTVGDEERELLNGEFQSLTQEVSRIAKSTKFNGQALLSNDSTSLTFKVTAEGGDEAGDADVTFEKSDTSIEELEVLEADISSKDNVANAIESVDTAINEVSKLRANFGATQSRLVSTVSNLESQIVNQKSAISAIEDVDVAASSAKVASANIVKSAGIATLSQANSGPASALRLIS